ncbi:hypothetical protein QKU48_gp0491 [Fadolivirus algeromassiliense]|jgi:hypothetical protein|uniref:Uncharacterized protein n=1 Tax=Fadolivirus FV1/VV64 TaxID=3070911 RepID=A0A7D3UV65_9VIRU|nr:hypothetical protein QKU48_gp0491 [Fadolivirus algeromassiliense]QKF93949.1 hypothetical protein Fadolivirus_1_491 [Fadolivirus FV1/VV64]
MSSEINKDIFYKASKKNQNKLDDLIVSSSLFTTSTPSKQVINENTESAYLNSKLMKLQKTVMDSDFLPLETNTDTDSINSQSVGKKRYNKLSSETNNLPLNSATMEMITPYQYGGEYGYSSDSESSDRTSTSQSSTNSESSTSSQSTSTSTSSEKPKRNQKRITKKQPAKKVIKKGSNNKNISKKTPAKKIIKKGSKKGSVKQAGRKSSKK